MAWIILGAFVVLIILWYIVTYNRFVSLATRVEEAFSTIDVFLKKRYDLVPNLVETVKGYASHERNTLDEVIQARGKAMSGTPEQRIEGEAALTQALGRLMVLAESYPNLKADTQFIQLQSQLASLESEIEKSRRYYNGVVAKLNMAIKQFPAVIVAGMAKIKAAPYFEITEQAQREAVKVQF